MFHQPKSGEEEDPVSHLPAAHVLPVQEASELASNRVAVVHWLAVVGRPAQRTDM